MCAAAQRIALKLRATRPQGAVMLNVSSCALGHNTPIPLKRSPPVSFKRLLGCSDSASVCSGSARLGLEIPIPHEKKQVDQDRRPAKRIEEARELAHESDDEAHSKPTGVPTLDRTKGGSIGVVLSQPGYEPDLDERGPKHPGHECPGRVRRYAVEHQRGLRCHHERDAEDQGDDRMKEHEGSACHRDLPPSDHEGSSAFRKDAAA